MPSALVLQRGNTTSAACVKPAQKVLRAAVMLREKCAAAAKAGPMFMNFIFFQPGKHLDFLRTSADSSL
jgi:hypothetical protein